MVLSNKLSTKDFIIELLMPVIFIGISIYFIVGSIPMGSEGYFPLICGVGQLLCAIGLLIKVIWKQNKVVKYEGLDIPKVILVIAALAAYVLLLEVAGYVICTLVLVAFIIRFLGYTNWKVNLLCSAATVAATYVIFGVLLSVPLPMLFF